jgi:hypothetical protein
MAWALLVLPLAGFGQRDEQLAFDRPEAWAMKYFAAVSLMQGDGPPLGLEKGQWAMGFEMANIPELSAEERTVGFNGTKEEDLNKAPLLARPLVHYGVGKRLSLTATYLPPVEVFDGLKTHMAGLAVNYALVRGERWHWTVRLIGQWTEAKGDFTAPAEIVGDPDPDKNPFEAIAPSRDVHTSWSGTVDSSVYYRLPTRRAVYAFINASYTYGDFDFLVYVPQADDNAHTRHLYADGGIWAFSGGIDVALGNKTSLRLSVLHAPLDVRRPPDYAVENDSLTSFRLMLHYRI